MRSPKDIINELLVEVFNHILSIENNALKKMGVSLSMNEVHTLEAIQNAEEPTMSYVAKRLRVTVGTLTTSINTLVRKNYVTRYRDDDDRRKVWLGLTDGAKAVLHKHEEFHREMIDALFQGVNIAEDELLLKSLENISFYFKNQY